SAHARPACTGDRRPGRVHPRTPFQRVEAVWDDDGDKGGDGNRYGDVFREAMISNADRADDWTVSRGPRRRALSVTRGESHVRFLMEEPLPTPTRPAQCGIYSSASGAQLRAAATRPAAFHRFLSSTSSRSAAGFVTVC